jgi:hypothetical protein
MQSLRHGYELAVHDQFFLLHVAFNRDQLNAEVYAQKTTIKRGIVESNKMRRALTLKGLEM